MIIRTRKPSDVPSSEITPEDVYVNRRRFIRDAAAGAAALAFAPRVLGASESGRHHESAVSQQIPARFQNMKSELDEDLNPYSDVTTYNNYYEFGTRKGRSSEKRG